MSDIWDEKPESEQWVKFKYPVKSGEEVNLPVYDAKEMDAWLEKVEEEYNEFYGDNFIYFSILNEITKHMKLYPDEKDPKYSGSRPNPSTGHTVWNMPYFLTHLETWIKELREILIPFQSSTPKESESDG